jgi:peptide/nickel transport system substrate-binding protein
MAGLLAGDFNLIENPTTEDVNSLTGNDKYSFTSEPSWRSIFLILDVGSDVAPGVVASDGTNPLKDLRVRQAMSLAINREAIVDRLMGGMATVANQFAPSYQEGADPNMPILEYDPEKAKALLIEAGYSDGFALNLNAPNDRYVNGTRVAQAIAQYWSRLGLQVTLKAEPWSVFRKGRSGREFGVFMYGWGHPQGPAQMTSYAFPTTNKDLNLGTSNYSNYHSDALDAVMAKWAVETDTAKSYAYAQEGARIIVADLPGIPLYYQHSLRPPLND